MSDDLGPPDFATAEEAAAYWQRIREDLSGAHRALVAAALAYCRLRIAESEAALESAPRDASARSAPSRAAVNAAEQALIAEARRWL